MKHPHFATEITLHPSERVFASEHPPRAGIRHIHRRLWGGWAFHDPHFIYLFIYFMTPILKKKPRFGEVQSHSLC